MRYIPWIVIPCLALAGAIMWSRVPAPAPVWPKSDRLADFSDRFAVAVPPETDKPALEPPPPLPMPAAEAGPPLFKPDRPKELCAMYSLRRVYFYFKGQRRWRCVK